jgi:hypothetical protein
LKFNIKDPPPESIFSWKTRRVVVGKIKSCWHGRNHNSIVEGIGGLSIANILMKVRCPGKWDTPHGGPFIKSRLKLCPAEKPPLTGKAAAFIIQPLNIRKVP